MLSKEAKQEFRYLLSKQIGESANLLSEEEIERLALRFLRLTALTLKRKYKVDKQRVSALSLEK